MAATLSENINQEIIKTCEKDAKTNCDYDFPIDCTNPSRHS